MYDLSILIPARNEEFLGKTVDDLLQNIEGNTEIIVVLDGYTTPIPVITPDPRITLIRHGESVGQRAAQNEAARLARGKYVMKVDAHCAFDKGFDVKMLADMKDDWTMVPLMKNLHAFDWVCPDGHRRYQSPSGPCTECGKETTKDVVWIAKPSPKSTSYCFDSEPHFQYFGDFSKRPEGQGDITPTMSLQGSCFMCTKEKYWELELCDESFGSWGSQGIEVAVKTWLSGGQVMCNKKTWYAHMFRTQGGDFGFPYPQSGRQIDHAKKTARDLFLNNKWPKQKYPISWLIKKFWPVPGWDKIPGEVSKGVIYYTDNLLDENMTGLVQKQIKKMGLPIVSCSLKPIEFGQNITLPLERGYLTMAKQILAALEASTSDIIFFTEHDVIYHPSHFDFTPPEKDRYYYNTNVWHARVSDGHAVYYDCKQLSGLCAYRELLIQHFKERVGRIEVEGYSTAMGFEPGSHNRPERIDDYKAEGYQSEWPNIDLRHDNNLTPSRWSQEEFRDQKNCQNWKETDNIPGWGSLRWVFKKLGGIN